MGGHIGKWLHGTIETQAMLRLPVGPEFWGAAGPHQVHALPPLGVAAAGAWLVRMACSLVRRPDAHAAPVPPQQSEILPSQGIPMWIGR